MLSLLYGVSGIFHTDKLVGEIYEEPKGKIQLRDLSEDDSSSDDDVAPSEQQAKAT